MRLERKRDVQLRSIIRINRCRRILRGTDVIYDILASPIRLSRGLCVKYYYSKDTVMVENPTFLRRKDEYRNTDPFRVDTNFWHESTKEKSICSSLSKFGKLWQNARTTCSGEIKNSYLDYSWMCLTKLWKSQLEIIKTNDGNFGVHPAVVVKSWTCLKDFV